jgi:hypothetical protein
MDRYGSGNSAGKKTAALPRGFFDGLRPLVEAMKPTFLSIVKTSGSLEAAAAEIGDQVQAMMWNGRTDVLPVDGKDGEYRFVVVDYASEDDALEVVVSSSSDEMRVARIAFECDREDPDNHIECAATALYGLGLSVYAGGISVKKVLRERRYKSGYILRDEVWSLEGSNDTLMERMAYNPSGDYIGDSKTAYFLCSTKGIRPEKSCPDHSSCSIGYSTKDKRWYGWSHRAICGFKVGDMLFEEGACSDDVPFRKCGKKPIETLQEARQAAINFAKSVS